MDARVLRTIGEMMEDYGAPEATSLGDEALLFSNAEGSRTGLVFFVSAGAKEADVAAELEALRDAHAAPAHRDVFVVPSDSGRRWTRLRQEADVFLESQLLFNCCRRPDAPKMRALRPEETEALCAALGKQATSFPRMRSGDPAARYHGFRAGDVVLCARSTDAGDEPYYRLVVDT